MGGWLLYYDIKKTKKTFVQLFQLMLSLFLYMVEVGYCTRTTHVSFSYELLVNFSRLMNATSKDYNSQS